MYQVGEGFAGEGADAAHVNTVLGLREGPVGTAWATALATPSAGHTPFLAVVRPNVPVQPPTLFVNKAADRERHARPADVGSRTGRRRRGRPGCTARRRDLRDRRA